MKANDLYFHVILLILLYKVAPATNFGSNTRVGAFLRKLLSHVVLTFAFDPV